MRGNTIHIISARKANQREIKYYEDTNSSQIYIPQYYGNNYTEFNRRKQEEIRLYSTKNQSRSAIASAIDVYFQQFQKQKDSLARLKQSPLIASFQGESGLSENSEEIFRDLIGKGQ